MRCNTTHFATMLLAGLLAVFSSVRAEQEPAKDRKQLEPLEVRALLEKGRASGSLPEGMVIRVSCCLGERKVDANEGVSELLKETWEFTTDQVRRIVSENGNDDEGNGTRKRADSRLFDSKNICQELLEGQVIEIHAAKGEGPEVAFASCSYCRGHRSLQVELNGETILELLEVDGPYLKLYRETDARAFGALYEKLASQARVAFNPGNAAPEIK